MQAGRRTGVRPGVSCGRSSGVEEQVEVKRSRENLERNSEQRGGGKRREEEEQRGRGGGVRSRRREEEEEQKGRGGGGEGGARTRRRDGEEEEQRDQGGCEGGGEGGARTRRRDGEEEEQRDQGGGGGGGGRGGGGGEGAMSRRRAASEGGGCEEETRRLRWRINRLEKEKLLLNAGHNQQVCQLQAESARLCAALEHGEAQGAELSYQLTVCCRDKRSLAERLQQDQHALQQEVEARDRLVRSYGAEKQRLHGLLQEQEEALLEAARRREELLREREELKLLMEREQRSRREEEEVLRSQVMEEQARRSSTERALQWLQAEHQQCQSRLIVAMETNRRTTSDLEEETRGHAHTQSLLQQAVQDVQDVLTQISETLHPHSSSAPPSKHDGKSAEVLTQLRTTLKTYQDQVRRLQEENHSLTQLSSQLRTHLLEAQQEVVTLQEEATLLRREASDWSTRTRELQEERERREKEEEERREKERKEEEERREKEEEERREEKKRKKEEERREKERKEEVERREKERKEEEERREKERKEEEERREKERKEEEERREEGKREKEREEEEEERKREEEKREKERKEREKEEKKRKKEEERREKERKEEEDRREKERKEEEQRREKDDMARLSFLYSLYQRLLAGCVLLPQPHSILGNFTWQELCDVITEQVEQLTSDLRAANDKVTRLQCVCDKKSVCVRELQRRHKCVLSRLEEEVRRREEAWRQRHTHTLSQLQLCRSHCDLLTSDLSDSRHQAACFRVACALLSGALSHAHRRRHWLCQQKALLSRRLEEREQLEREVRRLASALGGEEEEEEEEERKRRSKAVRRWRRSICMLLAVRRWRELGRRSHVLLQLEGGGGGEGGGGPIVGVCGGRETGGDDGGDEGDDGGRCARWLRSAELSSAILSSVSGLQAALQLPGSAHLVPAARSALSRLLQHLDQSEELSLGEGRRQEESPSETKALVLTLQQHFLLFSQRLHSAEMERRSLRLEVANQQRGQQQEARFQSVCEELRQALSREDEAQSIIREQTNKLHTHTSTQSLAEVRQELRRKERSLRILGKHLLEVQKERKETSRRLKRVIGWMQAAESSYKQVSDSLVQSWNAPATKPRPLPSPWKHLELFGAESMMRAPEVAACQSFLSTVSQLFGSCCSRIGWLEKEVSAPELPVGDVTDKPGNT